MNDGRSAKGNGIAPSAFLRSMILTRTPEASGGICTHPGEKGLDSVALSGTGSDSDPSLPRRGLMMTVIAILKVR